MTPESSKAAKPTVGLLPHAFVLLTALAWLVPNHYPPWISAWNEALAILGMLLLMLSVSWGALHGVAISRLLATTASICVVTVLTQAAAGKVLYFGDALMAVLYIGLWLIAILAGRSITTSSGQGGLLDTLQYAWLCAAIISVGIALAQWTGAVKLYMYAADLPPGGRPFANVAQPNHFSTICFLGLCSLLWVHQTQRISSPTLMLGAFFLSLGMLLSQSRTAWLQIAFLLLGGLALRSRLGLRVTRLQLTVLGTSFAIGVALWPRICSLVLIAVSRPIADQMQAGQRLPYWWSMLDAIGREPLLGYGWLQAALAQERVAVDHPVAGTVFGYSHNLLLDLILWNGLPIGALIALLLGWWFVSHVRGCRDAKTALLIAALGGIVIHAMLEYPIAYAYFLIPVGLIMGAIEGRSCLPGRVVGFSRWTIFTATMIVSALFAAVASEYAVTEEKFRNLRFELARIGVDRPPAPLPEGRLLTQLDSFLKFYRTEAKPGMSPAEMKFMREVSERYGFSTVMLRYALAAGLNGQPDEARETLARLCHIHARQRCDEAYENWSALQRRYPQLPAPPPKPVPVDGPVARTAARD